MKFDPRKITGNSLFVAISILIALITFPKINPVFANGIDPPLSWVFNYLIQGRLLLGKDIIFPHGPLAFIMYPLPMGINLWIAVGLNLIFRSAFVFSILSFRVTNNKYQLWIAILFSFILLALLDVLLIMIGLVIMGYLQYLKSHKSVWLFISFGLTVFALYVKAFVGIVCGITTIAFLGILVFEIIRRETSWKKLLFGLIPPILVLFGWFFMYGTFRGLSRYFYGMMQLAGDNSAAVSYYPYNNWWILFLVFGFMLFMLFLHVRRTFTLKYYILIFPALFAVWKYGMSREDYLHAGMYFLFIVMIVIILNLVVTHFRIITFITGIAIIFLSYLNLRNAYYFEHPVYSVSGLKTISGLLFDYLFIADTSNQASSRNIERNILNDAGKELIGQATTDIFPWDYSYIPANSLNWSPRPVLQSYASYTPWLDEENARHFRSEQAPRFLIWELRKITHDIHNGTMESIDGRYLLNDQPEAVLSIFTNYLLVLRQDGTFPVIIFEKRKLALDLIRKQIHSQTSSWNTWIDVPKLKDGILRVKTLMHRNWMGEFKSFLYKDEACYIYYMLDNDEVRMYRIVPRNAADGIWVNPLFMNAENNRIEPGVKKIMFRCSNPDMMKPKIRLTWEVMDLPNIITAESLKDVRYAKANLMLGKNQQNGNKQLLNSLNDLESAYPYWSFNPGPEKSIKAFSGTTSCKTNPESYSTSFQFPLDSLPGINQDTSWLIRVSAWINSEKRVDAILVISIERNGKSLLWKPVDLDKFVIENKTWNFAANFLELPHHLLSEKGTMLKVYVWNKGKNELYIDDMQVIIEK
jgi:hypothetical protein